MDVSGLIKRGMNQTAYIEAIGGEVLHVGGGTGKMRLPYSEKLVGDPDSGVVHGGVITGCLDHCCGMAVVSALREAMPIATLDLRIDYMKPATPGAEIFFEAKCIRVTHEIAFVRASAFHTEGDPIALSTGAFIITRGAVPPLPHVKAD